MLMENTDFSFAKGNSFFRVGAQCALPPLSAGTGLNLAHLVHAATVCEFRCASVLLCLECLPHYSFYVYFPINYLRVGCICHDLFCLSWVLLFLFPKNYIDHIELTDLIDLVTEALLEHV